MSKIKDLINFRKIKEVIDIDAFHDKHKMVENYVISKSMEDYLVHLLEDLQNDTHKAAQIIGNYGSGKSHLLAFIISILTEKELKKYSNYSGTFTTHLIFINIKILNLPSNPTDFPKNQYTMASLLIPI